MKNSTCEAGQSLRHLRNLAHLTLDQVAAEAAVSASYLSKVESGTKAASVAWIGHVTGVISRHITARAAEEDRLAS